MLFDLGPRISRGGQRFSPPDDHRGLYVSQEAATAGAEFAHGMQAWNSGDCAGHARFGMEVKLASVLDLTSAVIRRTLKTSIKELLSPREEYAANNGGAWPATWQLGHGAFAAGKFDAIRFPSYRRPGAGSCLLIFTERLVAGSTHVIIHQADGSEWERAFLSSHFFLLSHIMPDLREPLQSALNAFDGLPLRKAALGLGCRRRSG